MSEKSVYQKMLKERHYLYRPWIPICKSVEAEVISKLHLRGPILDIGCGNGLFGKYCFKKKIDVGLDCDVKAIEEASRTDIYKTLKSGDACKLPFTNESFSTILSVCVIEHIPDLEKVLTESYRTLEKGGKFIFTVPSENFAKYLFGSRLLSCVGLGKIAKLYGDKKNQRSGHLHVYSQSKWTDLLEEKNFEIDSINHVFPKEAVLLWSFFHSLPFKILFAPFRLFRDIQIKPIDNLLRFMLDKSLTNWMSKRAKIYKDKGGYLLIQAHKA